MEQQQNIVEANAVYGQNESSEKKNCEEEKLRHFEEFSKYFSLIPVEGKKPLESGWTKWCNQKRSFKRQEFEGRNAGIATGPASGVVVLDIDNHALFESFCRRYQYPPLPETSIVASGGSNERVQRYHYYFKYPQDGEIYAKKAFKTLGFDLIGDGGMVVAPFSVHPDTKKPYQIVNSVSLAEIPDWIKNLFSQKNPKWKMVNLDKMKISDEIKGLIKNGKPKGERSEAAMSVINFLVKNGLSDDQIFYIFYTYPIGEKHMERGDCDTQLQKEIDNARQYCKIEDTHDPLPEHNEKEFRIITATNLMTMNFDSTPVIDGLLEKDGSLLVVGGAGMGKSIFTLHIALALAKGNMTLWNQFFIPNPMKTLFVQSENTGGLMQNRLQLIQKANSEFGKYFSWLHFTCENDDIRTIGIQLQDQSFHRIIQKAKQETGAEVLILDPLISYSEDDENDNRAMRKNLDTLTRICKENALSVIVVHHTGKTQYTGNASPRGASAIGDWASNIITLSKKDAVITLKHTKRRSGTLFQDIHLKMTNSLLLEPDHPSQTQEKYMNAYHVLMQTGSFSSQKEFVTSICNTHHCKESNARKWIATCVENNLIIEEGAGKKNQKQYRLPHQQGESAV